MTRSSSLESSSKLLVVDNQTIILNPICHRAPFGSSHDPKWRTYLTMRAESYPTRYNNITSPWSHIIASIFSVNTISSPYPGAGEMGRPAQFQMCWLLPSWIPSGENTNEIFASWIPSSWSHLCTLHFNQKICRCLWGKDWNFRKMTPKTPKSWHQGLTDSEGRPFLCNPVMVE